MDTVHTYTYIHEHILITLRNISHLHLVCPHHFHDIIHFVLGTKKQKYFITQS